MKFISKSAKETIDLGKKYGKSLKGGEVIGLVGNLGSGKTHFTKGLALGLGLKKKITSPTFVLMRVYDLDKKNLTSLVHLDAYRLKNIHSLSSIGLEDYLNKKDSIIIIEWADLIKKSLPKKTKLIKFIIKKNDRIINM